MSFRSSTRARRLAACTALVLSAGMFLAGPASAGTPSPVPVAEQPAAHFTPPPLTRPVSGAGRAGAAAASGVGASPQLSDFDGDGSGDLIYRDWDGNLYTFATSGGGGLFNGETSEPVLDVIPIGNQDAYPSGPEVLTLSQQGRLNLYTDATPTSAAYAWSGGGWGIYNKVVAPGDVNDDGRADLVARDKDGVLWLYYATGNRSAPFSARVKLGAGWNIYDQLFGIGDNNGDGWADLLGRDTAGKLWLYAGTGDKTKPFAGRRQIGTGWDIYNAIFPVGDDNGDGNGELLARDLNGTLWYYTGKGDGTLSARQQTSDTGGWAGLPQFGGSGGLPVLGKEGVLARDNAGTMFWYGTRSTGTLAARDQYGDAGGWKGLSLAHLSSMDTNGKSDLAVVYDNHLYVQDQDLGSGWGAFNALVGTGDLTGDGKGDLLARDRSGYLYLYRGNGAGTAVGSRVRIGGGWGAYDRLLGAGDYNGDGRADLIARTSGGDLYLYAGTGVAASPFKGRVKIGYGWNAYSKLVAPGDLNADGKADLLGITSGGDVYRYLNTAPGKFAPRVRIGYGYGIYNFVQ
ncbi:FG-GAP repeat domain-containing protein [Streptomyces sp. NPDC017868]|uniref:FG-GAP repeat domain-containing protein n=1 Tax=Streptomyces sp. NPDC017868 TaxID=3365014 RepID=UPI0037947E92